MPVFSTLRYQSGATGIAYDVNTLVFEGPLLQFEVRADATRAAALAATQQAVPQGIAGKILVDTGASITAIEEDLLIALGIPDIGDMDVGLAHKSSKCKVYPCGLAFPGSSLPSLNQIYVVGVDLKAQKIQGLLGRDVLSQGVLVYNGSAASWTLAF